MQNVFNNLFSTILNPFSEKSIDEELSYLEILGLSWLFHFFYAFYSVMAVYIGIKTYELASDNHHISQLIYGQFNLTLQKFSIIAGISEAIFYPIVFHLSYRFWMFLLNFFGQVFEYQGDIEKNSSAILNVMFASNIFLMIPIAGKVISILAQGFYLYRGVMKKLEFTNLQASLVLMTPVFLIFLIAILIVSYFVFILSLI